MPGLDERVETRQRPAGLAAGRQEWRRLLFVHWPVPADLLRPRIPPALTLDLYEGTAWLSLVPFVVEAARPIGVARRFGLRFLETNVRTYVHLAGRRPGVYFFSLDAASLLAVAGARVALGLPYFYAQGYEKRCAAGIDYRLRRRTAGRPGCHLRYTPGEPLVSAEPGSLDFFLVERYVLYVQRGPTLWATQVHHSSYPLRGVAEIEVEDTLASADGLPPLAGASLSHFSPGVDVDIFPPHALKHTISGRGSIHI
jgi:uncharacterized protein